MNNFHKTFLKGFLSIALITGIGIFIFFFAGRQLVNIVRADFVHAVVKGQPTEIVRENLNKNRKNVRIQTTIGTLSCEKITLEVPVFLGDTDENLYYGAGIYAGGSMPGEPGTTLISAHNVTYFRPIEKIKENDTITFSDVDTVFTYQVEKIHITKNYESYTLKKEGADELVLYTCYPFHVSGEESKERFFITCSLVSKNEKEGEENEE